MLPQAIKQMKEDCFKLFSNRKTLDSLWQEVAEHFYPEVAIFTRSRVDGEEFASHLTSSFPLLARRSLGDALSALLRPVNLDTTSPGVWFSNSVQGDPKELDRDAKEWLEFSTGTMRRAMYDRLSNFTRAAKEGDHAFATFGQTPIKVELNRDKNGLLYTNHHLKDVAWSENAEGHIGFICRKWNPTKRQLVQTFRDKTAATVREQLSTNPFERVNAVHMIIEREAYEEKDGLGKKFNTPWVSIWIDADNDHVMEETGSLTRQYVIPRWVTVPGSQYASSPAVTAALPDARLLQQMTLTMLDASEKFADPPTVATQEAVRGDIALYAGGTTWVDWEYDERLGEAIRPLFHPQAGQGLAGGLQMTAQTQANLERAFFLDTLQLPPASSKEMTAFEFGERIAQWIRSSMPIFEPMEFEYNAGLCEETFQIMLQNGGFGSLQDIPASLEGQDITYRFESPIHQNAEKRKSQTFLEAKEALLQAAEVDPETISILDVKTALREALDAIGAPADWQRTESEVEQIIEQQRAQKQAEQQMFQAQEAATAAKDLGSAARSFSVARDESGDITGGTVG